MTRRFDRDDLADPSREPAEMTRARRPIPEADQCVLHDRMLHDVDWHG
jgi:hypothetical protein